MLGLLLRFCLVFGCGRGWFSFGGAVWIVWWLWDCVVSFAVGFELL